MAIFQHRSHSGGLSALESAAVDLRIPAATLDGAFFLNHCTSVGPRAPVVRPGSGQSDHWARPAGLGHQKARPGLDHPKSPRAGRTIETPAFDPPPVPRGKQSSCPAPRSSSSALLPSSPAPPPPSPAPRAAQQGANRYGFSP